MEGGVWMDAFFGWIFGSVYGYRVEWTRQVNTWKMVSIKDDMNFVLSNIDVCGEYADDGMFWLTGEIRF